MYLGIRCEAFSPGQKIDAEPQPKCNGTVPVSRTPDTYFKLQYVEILTHNPYERQLQSMHSLVCVNVRFIKTYVSSKEVLYVLVHVTP